MRCAPASGQGAARVAGGIRALVAVALVLAGCGAPRQDETRWSEPAAFGLTASQEWRRVAPVRWQWQLTGELDLTVDADVYELDAFTTPAGAVSRLHAANRKVICYLNAGAYEDSRPDAARFPDEVLGVPLGRPGERWLDIRRWDALEPILTDRLELCRHKAFDAVAVDNVDGYARAPGFPLTALDQLTFNRRLAAVAHRLGLAIGLTNDLDQAEVLEPDFDFAVNEECFRHQRCAALQPFMAAGKAVFHVEYDLQPARFCALAREHGFASLRKRPELDAWRLPC